MSNWILTDDSDGQYGRQLSEWEFEFKDSSTLPITINLLNWNLKEIEDVIKSYGYTLKTGAHDFIFSKYEDAWWIIAECIFEIHFAKK